MHGAEFLPLARTEAQMRQTNLGHYGQARWIRWSEQQARIMFRQVQASGVFVRYEFKDITCIWFS